MKGCNPCNPNHEKGRKVMEDIDKGEEGIISIFGIAEIGGFLTRNSSAENSEEFISELSRFPHLYIWYTSDFKGFMNTVTELSITKGLSGADAIHAVSALSISEVDKIITLARDFRKISDSIDVELLVEKS